MSRTQRGSVTVFTLGLIGASVACAMLVMNVSVLVARRARATAAADAAALAAAEELALGHSSGAARAAAVAVASVNQASLEQFTSFGTTAEVVVRVATGLPVIHEVTARARATSP